MKRIYLACALVVLAAATLQAQQQQQSSQQDQYSGTSNPPPNDTIVTDSATPAKPAPGQPMIAAQAAPAPNQNPDQSQAQPPAGQPPQQAQPAPDQPQPSSVDPSVNYPPSGAETLPPPAVAPPQPTLEPRAYASDPDGDIVHPEAVQPGEIVAGTTIRVRLLDRLSTAETEKGEIFRSRVATDVIQDGQVLIPAGTEIDGTVVQVSTGHPGSTGYMRLRPESVIMADGTRFKLFAELTGTPGAKTHVVGEGTIKPDSRWRKDTVEYGAGVGAGAVTGAVVAGPMGALTGSLIGAGLVTTHLLVDHPQATLEPGTTLLFTLTDPLFMAAPAPSGN
jgi:hypothetical protein